MQLHIECIQYIQYRMWQEECKPAVHHTLPINSAFINQYGELGSCPLQTRPLMVDMVQRLVLILDMVCRNGPIERCMCREITDSKIWNNKVRTRPICHVNQVLYVRVFMSLISESHHIHLHCHHIVY